MHSVRYCASRIHWTSHVLQGTRNTRLCITGHPVPNLFFIFSLCTFLRDKKGKEYRQGYICIFIQIKGEKRKGNKKGKKGRKIIKIKQKKFKKKENIRGENK